MLASSSTPKAGIALRSLLLVDDDTPFRLRLQTMLSRKGFDVTAIGSLAEARREAAQMKPDYAVIDMRLEDGNGLELVAELRAMSSSVRIVMLTGYGNLATAVAVVKAGAIDYLAKPADPEDIVRALSAGFGEHAEAPVEPMSADRVRWEHIQCIFELCEHNVSETARRLKMHRRTLQRILAKNSPA